MIPRPCLGCQRLTTAGNRCPECQRQVWRAQGRQRGPRPHYGGDYRARAKAVREGATACAYCGGGFTPANPVQADHVVPADPASPLVAACRRCNIAKGGR